MGNHAIAPKPKAWRLEKIMAKKLNKVNVNLATINEVSMEKLSAYHVATLELRSLAETFKADRKKVQEEIDALKENRKKALEAGESIDTVAVKFDLLPLENKLRALENKYKEDCKPHKTTQKNCLEMISDNCYYAYVLASKKGDLNAKGSLTIKKGKKSETIKLEKSLKGYIKAGNTDNDSAIDKFAQYISVNVSGMQVANKGDDYAKEKREAQFGKLFFAVFFQYAIIEKKVLEVNEDGTLKMRDFTK